MTYIPRAERKDKPSRVARISPEPQAPPRDVPSFAEYPFAIPAFRHLDEFEVDASGEYATFTFYC